MPLNDRQIRNLEHRNKPYKVSDGGGLFLLVTPHGKLWRLKFRINGKEKTLAIGKYPEISLAQAREAREAARKQITAGIDPTEVKREAKQAQKDALANTLKSITLQWHNDSLHRWQPKHADRILVYFEKDVFPTIGSKPINEISVSEVKAVIQAVAGRGALETAEKVRQWIGAVYKYAAQMEITDRNPAAALQGFLPKPDEEHYPFLPADEMTEFYHRLMLAHVRVSISF